MRMGMPETRRKYAQELREGAVRSVGQTGKPLVEVARAWESIPAPSATG